MINEYFNKANSLKLIIMVIDIRHDPTLEDKQMAEWIRYYDIPVVLVASKSDKLGKTRIKPQAEKLRLLLGFSKEIPIIPCSVLTKKGIMELLNQLEVFLD
jgi:GTP-binding protein